MKTINYSSKGVVSRVSRIFILLLLTTSATSTLCAQSLLEYGLEGGYTTDKVVARVMELNDTEVTNTFNYSGFYAGGSLQIGFIQTGLLFRYQSLVGSENPSQLAQYVPDKQMFLEVPITTQIGLPIVNIDNTAFVMVSARLGVMPSLSISDMTGYGASNKFDLKLLGGLCVSFTRKGVGNIELYYMLRRGVLDLDKADNVHTHTNGHCFGLSFVVDLNAL